MSRGTSSISFILTWVYRILNQNDKQILLSFAITMQPVWNVTASAQTCLTTSAHLSVLKKITINFIQSQDTFCIIPQSISLQNVTLVQINSPRHSDLAFVCWPLLWDAWHHGPQRSLFESSLPDEVDSCNRLYSWYSTTLIQTCICIP